MERFPGSQYRRRGDDDHRRVDHHESPSTDVSRLRPGDCQGKFDGDSRIDGVAAGLEDAESNTSGRWADADNHSLLSDGFGELLLGKDVVSGQQRERDCQAKNPSEPLVETWESVTGHESIL